MKEPLILIVDDETAFAAITAKRLAQRGFATLTAADGPSALTLVEERPDIDVVLLDVKMPGMDGLEVLAALTKRAPLIRTVLLTGHGTVESAVTGIKLGAFDYLLKPADIEALCAKLTEAVAQRRLMEDRIMDIRIHPYISEEEKEAQITAVLAGDLK